MFLSLPLLRLLSSQGSASSQQLPGRQGASWDSNFHLCRCTSWRQYLCVWVCKIRMAIWHQNLWVPHQPPIPTFLETEKAIDFGVGDRSPARCH